MIESRQAKRRIAITGAGSGIGKSCAELFLEKGYQVALLGRRKKTLKTVKNEKGAALIITCDISKPEDVQNAFKLIEKQWGGLDILFNNAGLALGNCTVDEMKLDDWKRMVDTNLTGTFLCAREAFRIMRNQSPSGGRIINNGSISAHTPRPGSAAYTATKHAITGLTKSLSLDGRDFNIQTKGGTTNNALYGIKGSVNDVSLLPRQCTKGVILLVRNSSGANNIQLSGSGVGTAANDWRAPQFYDSANTAYYLDPSNGANGISANLQGRIQVGTFSQSQSNTGEAWIGRAADRAAGTLTVQLGTGTGRKFEVVDYSWSTVEFSANDSGTAFAANDFRAPIFYDSNDTGYYVDPNNTSRLNKINISSAGAQGLNITSTDIRSSATSTWTGNPGANGKIQYHSNRWYIVGDSSSNRIVQFRRDGSDVSYIDNDGRLIGAPDTRSPVYYDSNDTNYYLDPAGNSNINTINGFGFSQQGGASKILVTASNGYLQLNNWIHVAGSGIYSSVNGAHFYPNQSSDYGAWRIQGTRNGWTGITFEVSGYYQNVMANANTIGFYNDTENEWMVECQRNSHTRLYYNGSEQARTDNGYFLANNQMRSPIYYDSNNSAYYSDPAATSKLSNIDLRGQIQLPASGLSNFSSGTRPAYAIYQEGGSWSSPFPDLVIAMHTGIKLGANASYGGIRFYSDYQMSDGASELMSINNSSSPIGASHVYVNNVLQAGSSLRTPIFYDSNNTGYYTNPAGTSIINGLTMAGALQTSGSITVGSSGTSNIYMGGVSGNYFRFHTNNSHTYFDGNVGDIHWRQGSSTRFIFYMTTANMTVNGTVTQYSDSRLKDNIITIDGALDKVNQLRGVYYNRTDINTSEKQIGLVAQEVESVVPEVVHTANDELNTKSISYAQLNALLVEAIKEQQTIIDDLKSRIETLENQ